MEDFVMYTHNITKTLERQVLDFASTNSAGLHDIINTFKQDTEGAFLNNTQFYATAMAQHVVMRVDQHFLQMLSRAQETNVLSSNLHSEGLLEVPMHVPTAPLYDARDLRLLALQCSLASARPGTTIYIATPAGGLYWCSPEVIFCSCPPPSGAAHLIRGGGGADAFHYCSVWLQPPPLTLYYPLKPFRVATLAFSALAYKCLQRLRLLQHTALHLCC